ncbi:ATP-binding protein [Cohnella massiliensis]|uniref:ATP-binding protein n=1 Tax=Cohnella massiliensis TaxID=1816691 RepID=UPI0015935DB6|nr:ATP-binding protein [Cohnella massiliensis]
MAGPNDRDRDDSRGEFILELRNSMDELEALHRFFEQLGERSGWSDRLCLHLTLACEELLTNTISYGYPEGGEHSIRLSVSPARAFVEIVLEDDAIPFNPLEAGAPDLEPSLEERAVGGLGIHFVKKLMDDVSYERTSSGNRLVLVKKV